MDEWLTLETGGEIREGLIVGQSYAIGTHRARRVMRVSSDGTPNRSANPGHRAVPLFTYNDMFPSA